MRNAGTIRAITVMTLPRRKANLSGAKAKRRANSAMKMTQITVPNTSSSRDVPQTSSTTTSRSQTKLRRIIGASSQSSRW